MGVAFWLSYGMSIGNLPVIVANAITFVLASIVLWLKTWKHRAKKSRNSAPSKQAHALW
jgi:MtN3 and saliva related transmembrane protein